MMKGSTKDGEGGSMEEQGEEGGKREDVWSEEGIMEEDGRGREGREELGGWCVCEMLV